MEGKNFVDFTTLNLKVNKYKKDYNLDTHSKALAYIVLENFLSLSPLEIEECITDAPNDRSIDAVFIDKEEEHISIFNFEYTETFDNSKKNFPGSEIDKIINIVNDIFFKKEDLVREVHPILYDKIKSIWEILIRKIPSFKLYICSNKEPPIPTEKDRLENALTKYHGLEIHYLTLEQIVKQIIEKKREKIYGEIKLIDIQYFERTDGDIRGLIGTAEAKEFLKLVALDGDLNLGLNEDIFDDNVRVYLGSKNKINKKIIESALSDKDYLFWYLNNGITLTCEKFQYIKQRMPLIKMHNVQVVNGGQTTHALYEAYRQKPEIDNILLLIRLYETEDTEITYKITESTNSQTLVNSRDLRANDDIQKRIEEQFSQFGYFYERKRNIYQNEEYSKRINNELIGQVYMSFYLEMPAEAKAQKTLIFGDKYDNIFNEETTVFKLLLPYELLNLISDERKKRAEVPFLLHSSLHILYTLKLLLEKDHVNINPSKKEEIQDVIKSFDDYYSKATKLIQDIVNIESSKDPNYSHSNFFKSKKTAKIIKEKI
ncbi:MAG: AIPR family protein [bacterium]|nr:AIPR family protein [bacterium]